MQPTELPSACAPDSPKPTDVLGLDAVQHPHFVQRRQHLLPVQAVVIVEVVLAEDQRGLLGGAASRKRGAHPQRRAANLHTDVSTQQQSLLRPSTYATLPISPEKCTSFGAESKCVIAGRHKSLVHRAVSTVVIAHAPTMTVFLLMSVKPLNDRYDALVRCVRCVRPVLCVAWLYTEPPASDRGLRAYSGGGGDGERLRGALCRCWWWLTCWWCWWWEWAWGWGWGWACGWCCEEAGVALAGCAAGMLDGECWSRAMLVRMGWKALVESSIHAWMWGEAAAGGTGEVSGRQAFLIQCPSRDKPYWHRHAGASLTSTLMQ